MAEPAVGRLLKVKKGSTDIAGVRAKTITVGRTSIDISSDDDSGARKLLAGANGQNTVDISVEGVSKNSVLRDIMLDTSQDNQLTDISLAWPNGEILNGTFNVENFEEQGPYQEAMTFTANLVSADAWTYIPVSG